MAVTLHPRGRQTPKSMIGADRHQVRKTKQCSGERHEEQAAQNPGAEHEALLLFTRRQCGALRRQWFELGNRIHFLSSAVQFSFHLEGTWIEHFVFEMHMLLQIRLEIVNAGKECDVRYASPLRRLKAPCHLAELIHDKVGRLMFLLHHEDWR